MGHKVGWLTLNAGMAGGADIILLPEIPYDIDKVIEKIEERQFIIILLHCLHFIQTILIRFIYRLKRCAYIRRARA